MVIPYLLEEWQREADIVTMDEHSVVKAVGNHILKQTLGKGSMGKVKLGIHIITGDKAAIKIVPRATRNRKLTPKELSRELRAIREGHLMMLLNHPHIVHLRDMVAGSHYYYFLMDYVGGGQLLHYIVKRDHLTEKRARHFCRQMVSALDYMHRNSVVHRDLKIENILVDRSGRNIKIIDFGLSNLFCPERQLTTYCGSLYFAAPELLSGRPYRGPEIDVWSLGVVLYVMVTGSVPFDDKSLPGLHEKIKRAQVAYPAHMSTQCHHLLSRIFVGEPQQRITLADIIRHAWLNEGRCGYVRNHLPFREPLNLPLDEQVLERMTYGFNLGTVDDIRMKMEVILQSSVYRISATHVSEVQALSFANHGSRTPSSAKSFYHDKKKGIKSCSVTGKATNHLIWGDYNDPQTVPAAYHPLLSIYYLTRERMKRLERQQASKTIVNTTLSSVGFATKESGTAFLENSVAIYPKQLVSSQQPNHLRLQSHMNHHTATATTRRSPKKKSKESKPSEHGHQDRRHVHYSLDASNRSAKRVPDTAHQYLRPKAHSNLVNGIPPSLPSINTSTQHENQYTDHDIDANAQQKQHSHHRRHNSSLSTLSVTLSTSSASSASTSSLASSSSASATLSPSFSSSLSRACLVHSSSSLPLPSGIARNTAAKNSPLLPLSLLASPSSSNTSKRKAKLFIKLGAFFRLTKNSRHFHHEDHRHHHHHHHHHEDGKEKLHRPPRMHHCRHQHSCRHDDNVERTKSEGSDTKLPSPNIMPETVSPPNEGGASEGSHIKSTSIPSSSTTATYQQREPQPSLTPTSSSSVATILTCRSASEKMIFQGHDYDQGSSSGNRKNDGAPASEINRHERTPSWLERRLSAWMDHAPLLNRSTSGLGKTK